MTDKLITALTELDAKAWRALVLRMGWVYRGGAEPMPAIMWMHLDDPPSKKEWLRIRTVINARKKRAKATEDQRARSRDYMRQYMRDYRAQGKNKRCPLSRRQAYSVSVSSSD